MGKSPDRSYKTVSDHIWYHIYQDLGSVSTFLLWQLCPLFRRFRSPWLLTLGELCDDCTCSKTQKPSGTSPKRTNLLSFLKGLFGCLTPKRNGDLVKHPRPKIDLFLRSKTNSAGSPTSHLGLWSFLLKLPWVIWPLHDMQTFFPWETSRKRASRLQASLSVACSSFFAASAGAKSASGGMQETEN